MRINNENENMVLYLKAIVILGLLIYIVLILFWGLATGFNLGKGR